jgi:SSS family solute:Na+ symporter
MATIDILIILGFIAYAIYSGISSKDVAGESLDEYFLAGRTLPGWKAGLSMAATQFAADTPLMVTGLVATAGVFSLWRLWIYGLAFLFMGFVLASSWRRSGVLTDAELTELRYGNKPAAFLRGVKAIYFGTIFNCMVLGFVLLAATRIAEPFLMWDQWSWFPSAIHDVFVSLAQWIDTPITAKPSGEDVWIRSANNLISIFAIVTVTTFYSTTGGLRSVVNTDVVQFGLMMLGTILFTIYVVGEVGGLGGLPDAIRERFADGGPGGIDPDAILSFTPSTAHDASFAICLLFAVQWFAQMNSDGTGYLAQRSMACRSDKDAKQAAVWFTVAQVLARSLLWLPLILGLLLLFPPDMSLDPEAMQVDREYSFVLGIASLPAGIKGLMVTGMLAALASTVDTHLNWGSSYWTNDIYKRFVCQSWLKKEPSPKSLVRVARIANIGILLIGLIIMTQLGSIAAAWQTSLVLGAGMGGVLILRWLWWRLTAWGELSAIIASIVMLPILSATVDGSTTEGNAIRLLIMFTGSTAAGILVSFITGPEEMEKLTAFYKKAHPPGYWGPVAEAAGLNPAQQVKKLWRGLAATALAGLSIFSLLTCIGSLLIDSPPPTWLPYRAVWLGLVGLVGVGLIPVWWKLAFSESEDWIEPERSE